MARDFNRTSLCHTQPASPPTSISHSASRPPPPSAPPSAPTQRNVSGLVGYDDASSARSLPPPKAPVHPTTHPSPPPPPSSPLPLSIAPYTQVQPFRFSRYEIRAALRHATPRQSAPHGYHHCRRPQRQSSRPKPSPRATAPPPPLLSARAREASYLTRPCPVSFSQAEPAGARPCRSRLLGRSVGQQPRVLPRASLPLSRFRRRV